MVVVAGVEGAAAEPRESERASRKVGSSCCRSAVIRARSTLTPQVKSLISLNGGDGSGGGVGAAWRRQPRAGSVSRQKTALCRQENRMEKV